MPRVRDCTRRTVLGAPYKRKAGPALRQPRLDRGDLWQAAATVSAYWLLEPEQLPDTARTDCTRRLGELMLDEPDP